VDDVFSSDAPPHRLETTVASPRIARPSGIVIAPVWAWVSRTRAAITSVLFAGGAASYAFPGWQVLAFPAVAVACQCLRRWNVLRWTIWSVTLAAFASEMLVLGTWQLRFVACLGLIAPFVFFAGSEMGKL
jgi:hypothetical protein